MNKTLIEALEDLPRYYVDEKEGRYFGKAERVVGNFIRADDLRAIIEQYKTEGAEPVDFKKLAVQFGGKFHGPNIEHLSIPETCFFKLAQHLANIGYASEPSIQNLINGNDVIVGKKNDIRTEAVYALQKKEG